MASEIPYVSTRKRTYRVYGSSEFNIQIDDVANKYLAEYAAKFPQIANRALGKVASFLSREIKRDIKNGIAGNTTLAPKQLLNNKQVILKVRKKSSRETVGHGARRRVRLHREDKRLFGKLSTAIGYRLFKEQNTVVIGWLSRKGAILADRLQKGGTQNITDQQRRFMMANRAINPRKTQIVLPARPVLKPAFEARTGQVSNVLNNYLRVKIGTLEASAVR